jgi:hypothetical protein
VLVRNSKLIKNIKRKISVFREYKNNVLLELSDHYGIEASVNFKLPLEFSTSLPYLTKQ